MPTESGLNDTLNKLSQLSSSSELSKVKIKRPARGKPGSESAFNLLGSILDDSSAAAEEEKRRLETARREAEEQERRQKEAEEEALRLDAERELLAEQKAQEELKQHQAEMQAQLQRQKDIEAGIINLEEEARLAREAEECKRAEEEAKRQKVQAKQDAIMLKKTQEHELASLKQEELARNSIPKKSKVPLIVGLAAIVLIIGGIATYLMATEEVLDPYALSEGDEFEASEIAFVKDKAEYMTMAVSVVKQEEEKIERKVTPKKKPTTSAKPAVQTPSNKPGLRGGGGLIGGGRKL